MGTSSEVATWAVEQNTGSEGDIFLGEGSMEQPSLHISRPSEGGGTTTTNSS